MSFPPFLRKLTDKWMRLEMGMEQRKTMKRDEKRRGARKGKEERTMGRIQKRGKN